MIESMTGEQKDWVRATPHWVYIVFAISVGSGVAGSICLLMRKKVSVSLLDLSFVSLGFATPRSITNPSSSAL